MRKLNFRASAFKTLGLALVLCFVGLYSIAQSGHHRGGHPMDVEQHLEKMTEDLNLTDQQIPQVKTILLKYTDKFKALHESREEKSAETREGMRGQVKELMMAQKEELSLVLTEEQNQKVEEHHQRRGKHRGGKDACKKGKKGQAGHGGHGGADLAPEQRAQMKEEIKTYIQTNILPAVQTERNKLDPALAKKDQRNVKQIRTNLQALRKEVKEELKICKEENSDREACREAIHAIREQGKSDKEAAKEIAEKYNTDIEPLLNNLKENKTTWEADLKEIKSKYIKKEGSERGEGERCGRGGKEGRQGACEGGEGRRRHHGPERGFMHFFSPVGFLLFEASAELDDLNSDWGGAENASIERQMSVYPNPSSSQNTLEYEVMETGMVKVELFNQKGNLVRSLLEEYKERGIYTIDVDLSALQERTYFYTVTDKNGKASQQFIIR